MSTYQTRKDVPIEETWNLADIYPNLDTWQADLAKVAEMAKDLQAFDGNIVDGKSLFQFLHLKEQLSYTFSHVYAYSMLLVDEDTAETASQTLLDQAKGMSVKVSAATAFFMPYLLSLEEETLKQYLSKEPQLAYFEDDLLEAYRYRPHVLSKDQEEILSQLGEALSSPSNTYGMLNNADIKFGDVTNENGEKVELTRGMYAKLIEDEDRKKRKEAYQAYYQPYIQLKNSIASTLSAAIKNNVTLSKLRQYPSALEKALFADNVPVEVYDNLILSTKQNLQHLHQYNQLRKEQLGVEELRVYDMNVPLVKGVKLEIPYEEAYETMIRALAPLGEEYTTILKNFKNSRYLDVRETKGKRSGAYNLGVYGVHPYILLNHRDDLDSLFTLAHECGHGVHSYLSAKHQPQINARYSIFVAEVASTVNEVLLIHYLLKKETDPNVRNHLLNHFIDQFKGTFFTQVMFAEFEKRTHTLAEQGAPINVSVFNAIYDELYRSYNGDILVYDEEVKYGWSRIPHFYRPFYVYKYATGYVSAIHLATKLLEGDAHTLETYLDFLKSGSSDYPLELLKKTGVDLTQAGPIDSAMEKFASLVKELGDSLQK